MIDAASQYDASPKRQEQTIRAAAEVCGSLNALCIASGLSRNYLTELRKGKKAWSFQVQYLLESIAKENKNPAI